MNFDSCMDLQTARNTQLFDAISILATQQATLIAEGYEIP